MNDPDPQERSNPTTLFFLFYELFRKGGIVVKKFTTIMAVLGAIALLWMVVKVINYGATNMRRVDTQAYAWKLEHYGP